ncbi:SprB repeat-containing protein [Marinoscillum sp.]|uniref:SprB repeat-containing protein n=1 Tax=Marinoscillum sp. TaxID=2024838 RepID=UPI003BA9B19A
MHLTNLLSNTKYFWQPLLIVFLLWGCESEKVEKVVDCSATNLQLEVSTTDASCNAADGSITLSVSGGQGPYTFEVGAQTNDNGEFNSLNGGSYTAKVTDANGCSTSQTVQVANADGVNIDAVTVTEAGCGTSQGSVSANAVGGTSPYTYMLSDHGTSADGVFDAIAAGTYELTITDDAGCSSSQSVEVLSGVSLASDIAPIIEQNCALSGCHANSQSPNLSSLENIRTNASRIQSRTSAGTMPPSGKLPDAEIDLITCWVNDGAPNN